MKNKNRINFRSVFSIILLILLIFQITIFLNKKFPINEKEQEFSNKNNQNNLVNFNIHNENNVLIINSSKEIESINSFSNSFSNSNNYIEIVNNSNFYKINFPIYWSKKVPYAFFDSGLGVVEAKFLFPTFNQNFIYKLNFSNFNISVFNSYSGFDEIYKIPEDKLLNSYFIFGDFKFSCSKIINNVSVSLIFLDKQEINSSFCQNVFSIFEFYFQNFDNYPDINSNYYLTFSKAKQFGAMNSGFFSNKQDLNHFAHELFHQWQPQDMYCNDILLYKEGFTTYMQYYSRLNSKIISEEYFQSIFSNLKNNLFSIKNIKEFYFLNEEELYYIRENNSRAYRGLVYDKGALIFNEIENSGISIMELFNESLKNNNCKKISRLIQFYEEKIYLDFYE